LAVRLQEGFLNHILRIVFVAGHAISQSEEGLAVALDEHTEGIMVASARPLHQRGVTVFHHIFRRSPWHAVSRMVRAAWSMFSG